MTRLRYTPNNEIRTKGKHVQQGLGSECRLPLLPKNTQTRRYTSRGSVMNNKARLQRT